MVWRGLGFQQTLWITFLIFLVWDRLLKGVVEWELKRNISQFPYSGIRDFGVLPVSFAGSNFGNPCQFAKVHLLFFAGRMFIC